MALNGRALIVAMCIGQVGNLLPHVVVPAVMAQHLMPLWEPQRERGRADGERLRARLHAGGAGPDDADRPHGCARDPARRLGGERAGDLRLRPVRRWPAGRRLRIWGLAGIGFAGAYMPGLKALTDRLPPGDTSRSVTLYTASFSFGVGLSFLVAQLAADSLGWRWAFFITALGPLAMIAACLVMAPVKPEPSRGGCSTSRPVFRNRAGAGLHPRLRRALLRALRLRTWIVASGPSWRRATAARRCSSRSRSASSLAVLAMPASIFGNEAAIRFGRHRAIIVVHVHRRLVAAA